MQGFLRRPFQRVGRMFCRQRQQAVQDPRADRAALLHHRFGPTAGMCADEPRPIQQMIQALLNEAAVG